VAPKGCEPQITGVGTPERGLTKLGGGGEGVVSTQQVTLLSKKHNQRGDEKREGEKIENPVRVKNRLIGQKPIEGPNNTKGGGGKKKTVGRSLGGRNPKKKKQW